jgi:Rad3-related DNA helicase
VKAVILEAPTGFGKTALALERAKQEPIIIAVPTLKLGKEVEKRAKELGLKAVFLEGRRNYPCGYKVQKEFGLPNDKEKVKEACIRIYQEGKDKHLFQGYFCCRKSECLYDMFDEKKEEAQGANVLIVTHALLRVASYYPLLPQGRVVFVDEVQTFLRALRSPVFPYNAVSTSELRASLLEIRPLLRRKKEVDDVLKFLDKKERELANLVESRDGRLLWIKRNGSLIERERALLKEVASFCLQLAEKIDTFLSSLRRKERESFADFFVTVKQVLSILANPIVYTLPSGTYAVARVEGEGVSLSVRQVLFSTGMWQTWNGILENLSPKELWLMSATIPESIDGLLKSKRIDSIERRTYYHRFNSTLDVIIGSESYSYEAREEFLDYFVSLFRRFKRKEKGAVILASSYRDIEYVARELSKDYSIAVQKENTSAEEVLAVYERGEVEVVIGNKSFWEGINVRRDSDFFILKVPYSTPSDPDYTAGEIYWGRNFFPIHKQDVRDLLIQGLGRIIRKDGEHKRVFIADRRILSFDCIFAEIPAWKRYLLL